MSRAPREVECLPDYIVRRYIESGRLIPLTALGPTPVNEAVLAELRKRVAQRPKKARGRR
jgi:hypothetical protein